MLVYNLRLPSFSGATAIEVAQKARQATLQQVERSIMAVGDPETTSEQINARWQRVAQSYEAPAAIAALAQKSCAPRTWPVEMRPGSVDGAKVWVAVCGWPAPLTNDLCIDSDCNGEAQKLNTPRQTEVVVLSDGNNPQLLAHVGRERLPDSGGISLE